MSFSLGALRMNRFSKIVLTVVVITAALSVWSKPSAAQSTDKLTFWSRDSDQALVTTLVKAWNASHPQQIDVTILPGDQMLPKLATSIAGGEAPDMLAIDLIFTPALAANDQLSDITDLAKTLPNFATLSPSHVRLGTYQDKIYALPFSAEGSILLWNKDLYKKAGLDPEKGPTTWDEIYQNAKKITALGNGNYGYYFAGACAGCNVFTFIPLIWASGGDVISDDGKTMKLNTPEVKAALELYRKLWSEKLIAPGAQTDTGTDFLGAFLTGKIGMTGSGAFAISTLKNEHPEINFGVTYLPGQNGGKGSFAGGDNFVIPKGSKHVTEAFEFIKWLYTDDVQLEQYAKTSSLPLRTDLSKNKYFDLDARLTTNAQAMALGRTPYSLAYNEVFNDPNGPWLNMMQTAIFDGKVDEAIKAAQDSATQLLATK